MLNGVHKLMDFELLCQANGIVPDMWVFCHFFRFVSMSSCDNYTYCDCNYNHALVVEQKNSLQKWASHYYWLNVDRVAMMHHRTKFISDQSFTLYSEMENMVSVLQCLQVVAYDFLKYILDELKRVRLADLWQNV